MTISKAKLKDDAEKAAAAAKRVAQAAANEAKRLADALEKPADKLLIRLAGVNYSGVYLIASYLAVFGIGLFFGCGK